MNCPFQSEPIHLWPRKNYEKKSVKLSMINIPTLIITGILVVCAIIFPKKYILLPLIIATCFIPADQRIIIAGLDFTPIRLLVMASLLRVYFLESRKHVINIIDKVVIIWVIYGAVIYIVQWKSIAAIIFQCGMLFDIIGIYLLFRLTISSWTELEYVIRLFAVCSIILSIFVTWELLTGRNPFIVLGNVTTWVREGRYRCQAAFPHSIMLGLFWATLMPIFGGCWKTRFQKHVYTCAIIASIFMIIASASSTPLLTFVYVVALWPLFYLRTYGRLMVTILCILLIGLHFTMDAPIWHLISRVDIVGGSTGWHRYNLINQTIMHFSEWMLTGCRGVSQWGVYGDDITNEFVLQAVRGGLGGLMLFCVLMYLCIKNLWSSSLCQLFYNKHWFVWGICVSLISFNISFLGCSCFGQIRVLFFMLLAISAWIEEMKTNLLIPIGRTVKSKSIL